MLVLSRKTDQGICIGSDIKITVVEIKGNQVKIGISAPQSVNIYREEVLQNIKKENLESVAASKPDLADIPGFLKKKTSVEKENP